MNNADLTRTAATTESVPRQVAAGLAGRKPRVVIYPKRSPPISIPLGTRLSVGRDTPDVGKIDDGRMSRLHAELVQNRSLGTFELRDLTSKNGTTVNGRPVDRHVLNDNDVIRLGDTLMVFEERAAEPLLDDPMVSAASFDMLREAEAAGEDLRPVLLLGPSGSGKTWLAKQIAVRSDAPAPFVAVNCGALQPALVDSELFGHVAGAFTGSTGSRKGLVESADGGTLFLDEIGTISLEVQARLLTCIEDGRIRRVGENKERRVDVRFLAATNLELDRAIEDGAFREDLMFRLSGHVIDVPPLAERRLDLVRLAVDALSAKDHRVFKPDALELLLRYGWPGNVRELHNAMATVAQSSRRPVRAESMPKGVRASATNSGGGSSPTDRRRGKRPSEQDLHELLATHGGNVAAVARELSTHRTQVWRWCNYAGIDPAVYREQ